jgi:hypothetical protein
LLFRHADTADLRQGKNSGRDDIVADRRLTPHDILGRDFALRRSHVRQHGLADNVADRIDPWHSGFHLLVDKNRPSLSRLHPHLVQSNAAAIQSRPTDI